MYSHPENAQFGFEFGKEVLKYEEKDGWKFDPINRTIRKIHLLYNPYMQYCVQ